MRDVRLAAPYLVPPRELGPTLNKRYLEQSLGAEQNRASQSCLGSTVLFVADLFHPLDDFTFELFLNGDMRHGCAWRSAMPMLLAGRKPDHIAGPDFLDRATPTLRPPESGCDNQRLTEWMRMPGGAGTWLERDACATNTCRFGCLEQRINANCAGKPLSWPFVRRL
jgi:hypothetical protein